MALLAADPVERPWTLFGAPAESRGDVGGSPTLDDAIVGAWEGLVARIAVACPLCGGRLRARPDDDDAAGGCCDGCGTTVS